MRRFACRLPVAAVAAAQPRFAADAAAKPAEKQSKMQVLHSILVGKATFKNKALVKECNVEAVFGAGWKAELDTYAKGLKADEKAVLDRQVARLALTRYTTRELADFAGDGVANVDANAEAFNLKNGRALLAKVGEAEFTAAVKAEGKLANWDDARINKFIADVKAKK